MAKKLRLKIDYFDEYHLLSIVSHLKDYRLAFHINQKTGSHFKKYDDLSVGNGAKHKYAWYYCHDKEHHMTLYLISNSIPDSKLIPSRKEIDFFLLIKNAISTEKIIEIAKGIRSIPNVVGVFSQEMATIRDMDVLLETIELHELEQMKKKTKHK